MDNDDVGEGRGTFVAMARERITRRGLLFGAAGTALSAALVSGEMAADGRVRKQTHQTTRQAIPEVNSVAPASAAISAQRGLHRAAGPHLVDHAGPVDATRRHHRSRPGPNPPWMRHWDMPVYSLADFRHRDPSCRFPASSVMLTVDDGPDPQWTPSYLRLFAKYDIKVTFNMIGRQVGPNRALVRAMAGEGHSIANHTWSHDERLPFTPAAHIRSEIADTNDAIYNACGQVPSIFRAPGGVWGPAVFAELARQRMLPLGWDIDPRDWARPGVPHIEAAIEQAGPSSIVLCHDGGGDRSQTYAALERALPVLLDRGLHFVTLPLSTAHSSVSRGEQNS